MLFLPTVLATLFLVLFSYLPGAIADHQTCTDKIPDNKPDAHGFTKFCDTDQRIWADYTKNPVERYAKFFCKNTDTQVADWNILRCVRMLWPYQIVREH